MWLNIVSELSLTFSYEEYSSMKHLICLYFPHLPLLSRQNIFKSSKLTFPLPTRAIISGLFTYFFFPFKIKISLIPTPNHHHLHQNSIHNQCGITAKLWHFCGQQIKAFFPIISQQLTLPSTTFSPFDSHFTEIKCLYWPANVPGIKYHKKLWRAMSKWAHFKPSS